VPVLQLREKHLPDDDLMKLATEMADVTRGTNTLLIINDRPDVAAAVGADGVHLGQGDALVEEARAVVGSRSLVGLSTSVPEEAAAAVAAGADYIGVGPVFRTDTKPDAPPPLGLAGLCSVVEAAPGIPSVAIGGISALTTPDVLRAGADYVAVISAICHAADPLSAIDEFHASIAGGARGTEDEGTQ
jgi:thiamine-phosphate diphosphorylase